MSTTFRTPAAEGGGARTGGALISTVKTWWKAYFAKRIERAAILQLKAMSDRELEDIGFTRSQIERVVKGGFRASTSIAAIGRGNETRPAFLRCLSPEV